MPRTQRASRSWCWQRATLVLGAVGGLPTVLGLLALEEVAFVPFGFAPPVFPLGKRSRIGPSDWSRAFAPRFLVEFLVGSE